MTYTINKITGSDMAIVAMCADELEISYSTKINYNTEAFYILNKDSIDIYIGIDKNAYKVNIGVHTYTDVLDERCYSNIMVTCIELDETEIEIDKHLLVIPASFWCSGVPKYATDMIELEDPELYISVIR